MAGAAGVGAAAAVGVGPLQLQRPWQEGVSFMVSIQ